MPASPASFLSSFRRATALALVAFTLSGCMTMVGFGYDHAETVAVWKADHYFDFEGGQEDAFRKRFQALYRWHRKEQLPEYIAFLRESGRRVQAGVTPADVDWFVEGLKTRYRRIVHHGARDAADLLAALKPEQVEHLRLQWDDDNRRFAAEHRLDGTPDERARVRAKRIVSQIGDWTGSLTDAQEARIAAMAKALPDTERLRYQDRLRRQREFVALLGERQDDRQRFAQHLEHWLGHWEEGRDPEYARLANESWSRRVALYVALGGMLTREQRANVVRRLQAHIEEFQRLARRD